MAATDRREIDHDVPALGGLLDGEEFVDIRVAPALDAIVAGSILVDTLNRHQTPFKVRVTEDSPPPGDATVGIGFFEDRSGPSLPPIAATRTVHETVTANGHEPGSGCVSMVDLFSDSPTGLERSTGLGIPTDDVIDGLVHSTLVHGPFSGRPEVARRLADQVDPGSSVAFASLVTFEHLEHDGPARDLPRLLGAIPSPTEHFATGNGLADVIDVLAEPDPHLALMIALGNESSTEPALERWREVAQSVHDACREAVVDRRAPVAHVDATIEAPAVLARVLRDSCVPDEAVVVTGPDGIGIATRTSNAPELGAACRQAGWRPVVRSSSRLTLGPADPDEVVTTTREVLGCA